MPGFTILEKIKKIRLKLYEGNVATLEKMR